MPRRSVVLFFALAAACSGGSAPGGRAQGPAGSARLAERRLAERPALVLVERAGDPSGAVAFAVAHAAGSLASAAAASLLVTRLAERGVPGVAAHPHALGFTLSSFARAPEDAARFLSGLAGALAEPPRPGEAGLRAARTSVDELSRKAPLPAQRLVAACSGELTPAASPAGFDPDAPGPRATLAALLSSARGRTSSALAAVGPRPVLEGLERAVADGPAWPATAELADPWPARDELGVDFGTVTLRRLSVAVRTSSADAAVGAAESLAAPSALLERRLGTLRPAWRVERALATARPRGGCVRVDLTPPPGDPGPSASDVSRALSVVEEELDDALRRPTTHALEEAVLRPADPREAASAAAWSTLSHDAPAAAPRRAVAYAASSVDKPAFDLPGAIAQLKDATRRPALELRSRNEPGQARTLALLGSACGTAPESAADAGEAALVVSALARAGSNDEVTFSPFITADGVGLLADTARLGVHERPAQQAARLGRALGERLTLVRPAERDISSARDELVRGLGSGTRPAYFAALDAQTRGHPSWLEPSGTLLSLGSAPAGGFDAALARFLGRPLRLAVLSNGTPADGSTLAQAIERLLRPVRGTVTRCPARPSHPHEPRELNLLADDEQARLSALSFPFAPFHGRAPREARAAVFLLNRPAGLLAQALAELSASATARALGGPQAAALTVEIAASSGSERAAVERVRALFDRLATPGAVPQKDLAAAQKELERTDASERFDPRFRVIELFLGADAPGALEPARLAQFLASLERQSAVLVNVAPRRAP